MSFIISMAKLAPGKIPAGLYELTRDVPGEVEVSYLVQWEGGTGGDVVSRYGIRLIVPSFGSRDSLTATIVLLPNFDVLSVQALFKKPDGSKYPFNADLMSYHDIDAKQVVDALCVDAPFDGVFALADRVCKGLLDGGAGGVELSRTGIKKVSQSVFSSFFPVVDEVKVMEAKSGYVGGGASMEESVLALVSAGYNFGRASRVVGVWEGLRATRNRLRWKY